MSIYEETITSLRELKNEEGYTMDEALGFIAEDLQDCLNDESVENEINRAVKVFITECGGNVNDYF